MVDGDVVLLLQDVIHPMGHKDWGTLFLCLGPRAQKDIRKLWRCLSFHCLVWHLLASLCSSKFCLKQAQNNWAACWLKACFNWLNKPNLVKTTCLGNLFHACRWKILRVLSHPVQCLPSSLPINILQIAVINHQHHNLHKEHPQPYLHHHLLQTRLWRGEDQSRGDTLCWKCDDHQCGWPATLPWRWNWAAS